MSAEIHDKILAYQDGDTNAALELIEKFKPLIKRYAFFLPSEDSFEDLQCFLLSMLKTWDTSRLSSTDDATGIRYIANSVKNEYIRWMARSLANSVRSSSRACRSGMKSSLYRETPLWKMHRQIFHCSKSPSMSWSPPTG